MQPVFNPSWFKTFVLIDEIDVVMFDMPDLRDQLLPHKARVSGVTASAIANDLTCRFESDLLTHLGFKMVKMDNGHMIPSPKVVNDERQLFMRVYNEPNTAGLCITDSHFLMKQPHNDKVVNGTEYLKPHQWTIISDRRIA